MSDPRVSVTWTAMIWVGLGLCIFGAIVAALGMGGSSSFEASIGSLKVKTSQVGLAIMVVGAAFAFFTAQKPPKGVMALSGQPTMKGKFLRFVPLLSLGLGLLGLLLLGASFLVTGGQAR